MITKTNKLAIHKVTYWMARICAAADTALSTALKLYFGGIKIDSLQYMLPVLQLI